jgi:hypothetical protein
MIRAMPSATDRAAYQRLIKIIHPSLLARHLEITRQSVYDWGGVVPERFVLRCSILSGIPPTELRPELTKKMQKVRAKLVAEIESHQ